MSVTVSYSFGMLAVEKLTAGVDGADNPTIRYPKFDESGTLKASSTPPVSKCSYDTVALSTGAKTIDLTSLVGPNNSTVDFTGLKVQLIRIKNLGEASMTFGEGASNGYELLGNGWSLTVPPGGVVQMLLPESAPDVASGAKTIDVSGTGSEEFELSLVAG